MELTKLFDTQLLLDSKIERKHPIQQGENRLVKRILALQVELSELANEQRSWKFWSADQKPRYEKTNMAFPNPGEPYSYRTYPLLEEFVDCLHFVLSIGIDLKIKAEALASNASPTHMPDVVDQFLWTNKKLLDLYQDVRDMNREASAYCFLLLFNALLGLGEMLGFTWEQIEAAYMNKNQINHERQANGY